MREQLQICQPPLWLAPTATTMMVMMIVMAIDTKAMIVKI